MIAKPRIHYPAYALTGDDSKKKDQRNQYPAQAANDSRKQKPIESKNLEKNHILIQSLCC